MWVCDGHFHHHSHRIIPGLSYFPRKNHMQAHLAILYNICYIFVYSLHNVNDEEVQK